MNNDPSPVEFSAAAAERKECMLDELTMQMRGLHHRRRTRKRIAACTFVLVAGFAVWWVWGVSHSTSQQSTPIVQHGTPGSAIEHSPRIAPAAMVQIVSTQSGIANRSIVRTQAAGEFLTDDALLDTLAQLDRPTGMIRSEGQVWLTSDVTDSHALR